jgi:hypothetical protein
MAQGRVESTTPCHIYSTVALIVFNNLVPFLALFLIYFFILQYSILKDSSSLNFLRWGDSSCAEHSEQIMCAGLPA